MLITSHIHKTLLQGQIGRFGALISTGPTIRGRSYGASQTLLPQRTAASFSMSTAKRSAAIPTPSQSQQSSRVEQEINNSSEKLSISGSADDGSERGADAPLEEIIEPVTIPRDFAWQQADISAQEEQQLSASRAEVLRVAAMMDKLFYENAFRRRVNVVEFQTIFREFKTFITRRANFPDLFDAIKRHKMPESAAAAGKKKQKESEENIVEFSDSVVLALPDAESSESQSQIPKNDIYTYLIPYFNDFAAKRFPEDGKLYEQLVSFADKTNLKNLYPAARRMKRKIYFHGGPTNSGKTHNALIRLKEATHGAYAAPLRLLAQEIYYRLNTENVPCNLLTGQERKHIPLANHDSCTVEMLDISAVYEVLVIDEIQMIGDAHRGSGWTRALLGAQAAEIHLCGDTVCLDLVRKLLQQVGEDVEVKEYSRLNELKVLPDALDGDWSRIEDQDAIITFSRSAIYQIKRLIEMRTNKKCCVIYGALPPETRIEQAELFNDPNSGYNVLVASDAVGMGLNLNIRRVIFHRMDKQGPKGRESVDYLLAKQIAGRAGRKKYYDEGLVTCMTEEDRKILIQKLKQPVVPLRKAGITPEFEEIELFAQQCPKDVPFSQVLERYQILNRVHTDLFLCDFEDVITAASIIDSVPVEQMPIKFKYLFAMAPWPTQSVLFRTYLRNWARQFASSPTAVIDLNINLKTLVLSDNSNKREVDAKMAQIEVYHKIIDAYLWLSTHLPLRFDAQQARDTKGKLMIQLGDSLLATTELNKNDTDIFAAEEDAAPAVSQEKTQDFYAKLDRLFMEVLGGESKVNVNVSQ